MKEFNTTAICVPSKHYMVDISETVNEISQYVNDGKYLTINRGRQYGKTTTLTALARYLQNKYLVISLDFQDIEAGNFVNGGEFSKALSRIILDLADFENLVLPISIKQSFEELALRPSDEVKMDELFRIFRRWFNEEKKPIVLIIDEVDSATNNQVFLDFLAQLRSLYIKKEKNPDIKTFQSVILAGVTDVRYLKSKIRDDAQHKVNSPWNIAADFDMDMSLSEQGIKKMLDEYEADHCTGMDTGAIAKEIREYTNGYPFLVSRICQLLDKNVGQSLGSNAAAWTSRGIDEAVKLLLSEDNTLFKSLIGKLQNYSDLKASLRSILMEGARLTYNVQNEAIAQLEMYGFIRNDHNVVRVSNRIFETLLYNMFLSDEEISDNVFSREGQLERNHFVTDGKLNMRLIMDRFIVTYTQIMGPLQDKFKEKDGRELFLLYIKPIINGTGNYYIEAQTRDQTRTDIIIDYLGQQYIIELKIWRGERYNADGEKQISEYLDYFGLQTGYMLSFNFNKNKEQGVKRVEVSDKVLFEGTV